MSEATPIYTPPEADMFPKLATTLQPFSLSLLIAEYISWLSPTVPPGESILSINAGNYLSSICFRALRTETLVELVIGSSITIRAILFFDLRLKGQIILLRYKS